MSLSVDDRKPVSLLFTPKYIDSMKNMFWSQLHDTAFVCKTQNNNYILELDFTLDFKTSQKPYVHI